MENWHGAIFKLQNCGIKYVGNRVGCKYSQEVSGDHWQHCLFVVPHEIAICLEWLQSRVRTFSANFSLFENTFKHWLNRDKLRTHHNQCRAQEPKSNTIPNHTSSLVMADKAPVTNSGRGRSWVQRDPVSETGQGFLDGGTQELSF